MNVYSFSSYSVLRLRHIDLCLLPLLLSLQNPPYTFFFFGTWANAAFTILLSTVLERYPMLPLTLSFRNLSSRVQPFNDLKNLIRAAWMRLSSSSEENFEDKLLVPKLGVAALLLKTVITQLLGSLHRSYDKVKLLMHQTQINLSRSLLSRHITNDYGSSKQTENYNK